MAPETVRSILCPIDFSPQSELALDYAILLADKFGAALTVAHAERFEPPLEFTSAQATCEYEPVVRKGSAAEQIVRMPRSRTRIW